MTETDDRGVTKALMTVREEIDAFDLSTMEAQYTDSGDAEQLLIRISTMLDSHYQGEIIQNAVMRIDDFLEDCAEAAYMDTGDAWGILREVREAVATDLKTVGIEVPEPPKDPNLVSDEDEDDASAEMPLDYTGPLTAP